MSKNISSLSGRDGKELDDAALGTPSTGRFEERHTRRPRRLPPSPTHFLIGEAVTYGTSSFYDFLKKDNAGKKAYVCNGSACLVAGTQDTRAP